MAWLLDNAEETEILGRIIGGKLSGAKGTPWEKIRALYLRGTLGSGKTTLTRGLVAALPGGEDAEVASPSFTLCNIYPTRPALLHADLYRLGDNGAEALGELPEDMEDSMDDGALLVLEWPEYLAPALWEEDRLEIGLHPVSGDACGDGCAENLDIPGQSCEMKRLAVITAHGAAGAALLEALQPLLSSRFAVCEA